MKALGLFSLKNRVAVVLGGTSGIGLAIARGFAEAGATTIASSRDQAKVDSTAAELEALGAHTLRMTSDVQDRASLQRLCDEVVLAYGQVDVLMVTSGAHKKTPSAELTEEEWNKVIDINLNGTFRANQIFGRQMLKQRRGAIINTCSMTTFVSFDEVAVYSASKAGVHMLTRSLACEWAHARGPGECDCARGVPHAVEREGAGHSGAHHLDYRADADGAGRRRE